MAVATSSSGKDRLERFRTLRARLDPTGDPAAAMAEQYVEPARSVSSRIAAELALAPASSHLLIGGIGSGKTTELLAARQRMSQLDDVRAFYIDVSKQHDIAKMAPGAVAVQVGLALADALADSRATGAAKQVREIAHGYWDDDDGPEGGDGSYVAGVLVSPEQVAESVTRAMYPIELLSDIARGGSGHVIVLLDGLDRMTDMQAFEQVVAHDLKALASIGIGVVLVGPLRALYGLDRTIIQRFDSYHYQAWIDGTQSPQGSTFLTDVLSRRVGDAIDPSGVQRLAHASGGVLRDLLTLAQAACVEAYMGGSDRVEMTDVIAATESFGRKHMQGLRPAEIEVLQRVRLRASFVQTSEDDLALLMTRRVLEYRKDDHLRYAVHPTIEDLLRSLADG